MVPLLFLNNFVYYLPLVIPLVHDYNKQKCTKRLMRNEASWNLCLKYSDKVHKIVKSDRERGDGRIDKVNHKRDVPLKIKFV